MNIGTQHLSVIAGAPGGESSQQAHAPRRDVAIAVIVAAVLLLGAAIGGAFSTRSEVDAAAHSVSPAPEPTEGFVYFPSQYVNQATEVEEHIQAF